MQMNQETELKYRLDESSYLRIRRYAESTLSGSSEINQVNYYLDTPSMDCAKLRLTLRIRLFAGKQQGELTVKMGAAPQGVARVSDEYHAVLDAAVLQAAIETDDYRCVFQKAPDMRELLASMGVNTGQLYSLGALHTCRTLFWLEGYRLELDVSTYLGCRDWELECETACPADADKKIRAFLGRIGAAVLPQQNTVGKKQRFLERYLANRNEGLTNI